VLTILVYQNYRNNSSDQFVGRMMMPSIGNNYYPQMYPQMYPPGVQPTGQPMMYPEQMYPKTPYYYDTNEHVGRPCKGPNGCGVFGKCEGGSCTVKDQQNTVFDIDI
jgi:hypothetical protein